jgi:transcriptional regulator with GAF, ATPase, and Fis domain
MDRLFGRLQGVLPVSDLLVRRLDVAAAGVETVAAGTLAGHEPPLRARTDSTPGRIQALAAWCRAGSAASGREGIASAELGPLLPDGIDPDAATLVPLAPAIEDEDTPPGVLVAVRASETPLAAPQRTFLLDLAEPFAAALANDTRIREMRRLREAVEAENRALLSRLGQPPRGDVIIGMEEGLRPVMKRVELVARSDVPVLIIGETGTGKEVIARAIHNRSSRAAGPMIRVNCGAIPSELVDSELFGHERGSFTGATATRQGWFERADGGTLFLDEVGELPLAAQVRFLRILQDGTFERVGGQRPLVVDVRVVAATHRDLPAMVREGRFREDLWYRICVFPVHLPALRERPEDISALATHFALRAARRLGLAPALPTPRDIAVLSAYAWPGNVRELISVIERAAILGDGKRLEVEKALGSAAPPTPPTPPTPPAPRPPRDEASLDSAMARHIEGALRESHGRIEGPFGAARRLGKNPHTLRARMRRLGVDWRKFRD